MINQLINLEKIQILSPLDQFEVKTLIEFNAPLFGYIQLNLTNIALYLIVIYIRFTSFPEKYNV